MKIHVGSNEVIVQKRFFFFTLFCIFAGIFIQVSPFKNNNYDKKNDTKVLAAVDGSPASNLSASGSAPELIETDLPQDTSSDISSYQPVTISHTVAPGDTLYSIAQTYHADPQTIIDYPPNEIGEDITLSVGQVLIIPNGYIDSPPPIIPVAKGSGIFSWPTKGIISQYAFWWHPGAIDIAAKTGSPIYAAYSGRVKSVEKWGTGYGWHVIVEHTNGYTTLYAHMSDIHVNTGQIVNQGTRLGLVGSTGRSTGPHLHFEVRKGGVAVDPMTLLPSQ